MNLLFNFFTNWDKFITGICAGALAFFAPIQYTLWSVMFFVIVDAFLGYKVSIKIGNSKFKSCRMWKTINKCGEAMLLIIGAHIIDSSIVTSINLHAVEFTAGIICGSEFISWLESLKALRPNSLFVRIVDKVMKNTIESKSEKYLGKQLELDNLLEELKEQSKEINKTRRKLKNKSKYNLNND